MQKLTLSIFALVFAFAVQAQKKETRKVDNFDYVSFGISGNLVITQGNSNSLVLKGDADDLEKVKTYVKNGKLIIIDMVTAPLQLKEIPSFAKSKLNHYLDRRRHPVFYNNLQKLVSHKDWANMLHYNPIRSQHEMVNYLISRYPSGTINVINVGLHSRVVAFEVTLK